MTGHIIPGPWTQTASGKRFHPFNPESLEVDIDDIAPALSKICRFHGQCSRFYSVAEHSLLVAWIVAREHPSLELAALLHDASEAYLCDIPSPLKQCPEFAFYREIEHRTQARIEKAYFLQVSDFDRLIIKQADELALTYEAHQFMPKAELREWGFLPDLPHWIFDMHLGLDAEYSEFWFRRDFARLAQLG